MQEQAKITSKGQVTIPRKVRRLLGVDAGDSLLFESDGEAVRVRPLHKGSPFAKYQGIGNPGIGSGMKKINRWLRDLRGE
jgi:AbrB family looped-hinge helix DNA binding protein